MGKRGSQSIQLSYSMSFIYANKNRRFTPGFMGLRGDSDERVDFAYQVLVLILAALGQL